MILHLIKHSPFNSLTLEQCLSYLNTGDGILLLENGVYALNWQVERLKTLSDSHALYVLESDAITRGFETIPTHFIKKDYPGFVDLTLRFQSSISW